MHPDRELKMLEQRGIRFASDGCRQSQSVFLSQLASHGRKRMKVLELLVWPEPHIGPRFKPKTCEDTRTSKADTAILASAQSLSEVSQMITGQSCF